MTHDSRVPRLPSSDELSLLLSLASGPRSLTQGPVGQCTKRGWCQTEIVTVKPARTRITYALTDAGWAALATIGTHHPHSISLPHRSDGSCV